MGAGPIYVDPEMTVCICPRCRKRHKKKMKFTGRGIPRIYCRDCIGNDVLSAEIVYSRPLDNNRKYRG